MKGQKKTRIDDGERSESMEPYSNPVQLHMSVMDCLLVLWNGHDCANNLEAEQDKTGDRTNVVPPHLHVEKLHVSKRECPSRRLMEKTLPTI